MGLFRRIFAAVALLAIVGGTFVAHHHADHGDRHGLTQTDASCAACQALSARVLPPPTVIIIAAHEVSIAPPPLPTPAVAPPQIDCLRIAPSTSPPQRTI